jgi:hypothetical protein
MTSSHKTDIKDLTTSHLSLLEDHLVLIKKMETLNPKFKRRQKKLPALINPLEDFLNNSVKLRIDEINRDCCMPIEEFRKLYHDFTFAGGYGKPRFNEDHYNKTFDSFGIIVEKFVEKEYAGVMHHNETFLIGVSRTEDLNANNADINADITATATANAVTGNRVEKRPFSEIESKNRANSQVKISNRIAPFPDGESVEDPADVVNKKVKISDDFTEEKSSSISAPIIPAPTYDLTTSATTVVGEKGTLLTSFQKEYLFGFVDISGLLLQNNDKEVRVVQHVCEGRFYINLRDLMKLFIKNEDDVLETEHNIYESPLAELQKFRAVIRPPSALFHWPRIYINCDDEKGDTDNFFRSTLTPWHSANLVKKWDRFWCDWSRICVSLPILFNEQNKK